MTIEEAIKCSVTMSEAAKKVNMPFESFKRKAVKLGLYIPNQGARGTRKEYKGSNKIELNDILNGKYPQYPTDKLKKRLISENYLNKICTECGITDSWNGKPIVLHLDHINGTNNDHRLENLRLLCPNCHSQTDTWCGRGKRKPA
jgi:5-methylcytosine-specific restriction endonuclease McrA